MSYKHTKRHSPSLIIRKTQMKIIMDYYHIPDYEALVGIWSYSNALTLLIKAQNGQPLWKSSTCAYPMTQKFHSKVYTQEK